MAGNGIYFNGSAEQQCEVILSEGAVYMYLQGSKNNLEIWKLRNTGAVYGDDILILIKNKDPRQRLQCSGELARTIYEAWQHPPAEEKPKREIPRRVYALLLLGLIAIVAVCVLIYVRTLPWIAERSVALIPVNVEIQMGDNLAKVYEQNGRETDSANYFLSEFAGQLRLDTKYPLRVELIRSEELNAFALPGGRIFIYSGLLKKMSSYEELTALLGHEITHVIHRHSLKSIFRSAAANLVIAAVFGNASTLMPWVLSKADEFRQLDYSRDLETEADDNGVLIMVQNKVDPHGMLDLLQLLKKESHEEPALMKYLSTHPETDARIANIMANPALKSSYNSHPSLEELFKKIKASAQ